MWGLHVNDVMPGMAGWIERYRPAWIKLLHHDADFVREVQERCPEVQWIGRLWVDPDQKRLLEAGEQGAEELFGRLRALPTWPLIGIWEDLNETGPHPTHEHMRFSIRMAELLHGEGKRHVYGSLSVGTWAGSGDDPMFDWRSTWVTEALKETDFIGVHEYCAPRMDSEFRIYSGRNDISEEAGGYFTLRHKKWIEVLPEDCRKPILITECGIDSGACHWDPGGQGGWRSFTTIDDYLMQLRWYRQNCHPLVKAIIPFCFGARDPTWRTFDLWEGEDVREAFGGLLLEEVEEEGWIDLRDALPRHPTLRYEHTNNPECLVIHHSASPPSTTVEAIARWHVFGTSQWKEEWPGIGYHFVISQDGKTFWVNDLDTASYHCKGWNERALGACLVGDFTSEEPTEAQLASAKKLAAELGYPVVGHRELADTQCPGDTWPRWKGKLMPEEGEEVDWKARALAAEEKLERIKEVLECSS